MPRDRDNIPLRDSEKSSDKINDREEMNKQKVDKTYLKNANASGLGSIGRSDENNLGETDKEDKIY